MLTTKEISYMKKWIVWTYVYNFIEMQIYIERKLPKMIACKRVKELSNCILLSKWVVLNVLCAKLKTVSKVDVVPNSCLGFILLLKIIYTKSKIKMANLRQTPLTCSGHTRPVVHLDFSSVTPSGYFLISACKGKPNCI